MFEQRTMEFKSWCVLNKNKSSILYFGLEMQVDRPRFIHQIRNDDCLHLFWFRNNKWVDNLVYTNLAMAIAYIRYRFLNKIDWMQTWIRHLQSSNLWTWNFIVSAGLFDSFCSPSFVFYRWRQYRNHPGEFALPEKFLAFVHYILLWKSCVE